MTAPVPYLHFPGTAREALTFYSNVFGCSVQIHTYAEFGRSDASADSVAHGYLTDGPVELFAADVAENDVPFHARGVMFALLGTAAPAVLHRWFDDLSESGHVIDPLQERPWGASDGQVIDRYGLHWLIGFESNDGG